MTAAGGMASIATGVRVAHIFQLPGIGLWRHGDSGDSIDVDEDSEPTRHTWTAPAWCEGTITSISADHVHVSFDDGDQEDYSVSGQGYQTLAFVSGSCMLFKSKIGDHRRLHSLVTQLEEAEYGRCVLEFQHGRMESSGAKPRRALVSGCFTRGSLC